MGYYEPDAYNQPEHFGLKVVGRVEWEGESYQFRMTAVWTDLEGNLYCGSDSGCSCPSPFEDFTSLDMLTKAGLTEVCEYLQGRLGQRPDADDPKYRQWGEFDDYAFERDVEHFDYAQPQVFELIYKLRRL